MQKQDVVGRVPARPCGTGALAGRVPLHDVDPTDIPARSWDISAWDTAVRYSANGAEHTSPGCRPGGNEFPFPSAEGA